MTLLTQAQGVNVTSGGDTSSAKTIIALVVQDNSAAPTDSKGNTWTGLTDRTPPADSTHARLWYCVNPTVGSGHTMTCSQSYGRIMFLAFSEELTFEAENYADDGSFSVSTVNCGSITPPGDGRIMVAASCLASSITGISIDSSYTIPSGMAQSGVSGTSYGGGMAYQIQTTATTRNPAWSWTTAGRAVGVHASFSVVGGGGSSFAGKRKLLLGVG